jgi:hypothetical protein
MPETTILSGDAAVAEAAALPTRRQLSPQRLAQMDEALRIFEGAMSGNLRGLASFQEALSTSDFPSIFGDVLDRELMAQYEQLPPLWRQFARSTTVRDFRPKKWVDLIGGRGILEPVPELDPYPMRKAQDGVYTLKVGKFGARFAISWEDVINDDLGALADLPNRLAQSAIDTEDYTATTLLSDGTGPNDAFFNATAWGKNADGSGGSSNLLTGNPVLSMTALSNALTAITSRRDTDGRPIVTSGFVLVVPPALEVLALQIINTSTVELGTLSDPQRQTVNNWLRGKVEVVVNPWLPVVDLSGNVNTTWYLLPKPTAPRPGLVLGFLRGHEAPDLRIKADGGARVGGSQVGPTEGSFEIDDIQYRVRHVLGAATLDPISTAVSNGSGS